MKGKRAKGLRRADMLVKAGPGCAIKEVRSLGVRPASAGEIRRKYVLKIVQARPYGMGAATFRKPRRERISEQKRQENKVQTFKAQRRPTKVFRRSGFRSDGTEGKTRGLTTLFCCFIGGLMILFFALPKQSFSGLERRELKEPPVFNERTVFNGKFEDDAEEYISDHFPFRNFLVGLNSYSELSQGRTLVNDIYIGKHWWLMQAPQRVDEENLALNMDAARALKEQLQIPAFMLAVPATGYIMNDEMPDVHLPYQDTVIAEKAQQVLSDGRVADRVQWIDLVPALYDASRTEQVYYRTDHHWTTQGAYQAYLVWAETHGYAAPSRDAFSIERYGDFLGTSYAKVLLWGTPPDVLELWQYPAKIHVELMDADKGMEPAVMDTFYDMTQLKGYDPYAVFFGGNHSVVRIINEDPNAQDRLLMIKDSYANCLAPFLARHYGEIVMIDPRYFKDIQGFLAAEEPFNELLFVYGIQQLAEDEDLGRIVP